jgi:SPP1 family predicted phage head-tail adaptor
MSLSARLNKRIVLQHKGEGQDAIGQPVAGGWINLLPGDGKVWAELRDITGREFVAAGATRNVVITTITIRHRDGVAADMRVLHGADVYSIEAVIGQDRRTLQLMCSRGMP